MSYEAVFFDLFDTLVCFALNRLPGPDVLRAAQQGTIERLTLVLSTLAAIQAPIIMMSQKRQESKDRLRSESDYRVNLKAELEIRHLHEKMDHLISRQWQRLAEIQQMQIETMHELTRAVTSKKSSPI